MDIIVYTCPECGSDLEELVYPTYPPIHAKRCNKCGWKIEEEPDIVRIPYTSASLTTINSAPDPCKHCSNYPSNGGSGICHCILGNTVTY